MDTREWFDEATYSDLTVRLSDGTEIKVHKVIVCRANDYFRKLCGPESHFAESGHKTIELKDDDPDALRNVLRNIYQLPIEREVAGKEQWRFLLDLHQTADKYLEPQLSRQATSAFCAAVEQNVDADTILDIVEAINNEMAHDQKFVAFGENLRRNNLGILLKNDRFRARLDSGGKGAIWQQLDELAFAADLEKKRYYLCSDHFHTVFCEPAPSTDEETAEEHCAVCEAQVRHDGYYYGTPTRYEERTAWLPK